jgi:hypothetical protein
MLSARNVIAAVVALVVLSLGSGLWMLFANTPGDDGWGDDSMGVRAGGFRGAHDTLLALGVPVERQLIPRVTADDLDAAFVMWAPLDALVQAEPAHIAQLAEWVKSGGRLTVTLQGEDKSLFADARASMVKEPKDILTELGLPDVFFLNTNVMPEGNVVDLVDAAAGRPWRKLAKRWLKEASTKVRYVPVKLLGKCREWPGIKAVCMPEGDAWSITYDAPQPTGRITYVDVKGEEQTLAAIFPVGAGEVAVMAAPAVASNWLLGEADNSPLTMQLMTLGQSRVIFDEFYHGLTIRGNALWLLTQPGYAALALAIVALVGVWIWRSTIFLGPPLDDRPISRRSIGEYLDAMSRFLLRGRGSGRFVLAEVRSGALWSMADGAGLPPDLDDVDRIAAAVARRDPQRAARLEAAVKNADVVLSTPNAKEVTILAALRKVNDCLSN